MLARVLSLLRRRASSAAAPPNLASTVAVATPDPVEAEDAFRLPFDIRPKTDADNDALRTLFRDSVLTLGRQNYDADALADWANSADRPDFCAQLDQGTTLIAELYGDTAGFAQLYPQDTIRMLYLAPQAAGLGIAVLLYQHLEDEARLAGIDTLYVDSSLTAERFFSSMGFSTESTDSASGSPVRQRMRKVLHS